MKGVLVCKTCLITNVKMFHLDILANAYSELTGLQCNETTEYVCYECAALLLKYQQFRTKCLQANQVISEFVRKYCKLTENAVSMIDRKLHNLESTIMKFEIKENIFNEIYNESKFNENDNEVPVQSIKMEIDDVIKDEPSENKDKVELYDEDQVVSHGNESLHESLNEDDTSVDEGTIIFMVTNETDDENTKYEKIMGSPTNKLDQESVEEGKNNSSTGTLTKRDYSLMEEYVTIVNLTPEEAKKEVLLRKESGNYKKNPYKCDLCYKGYGTLQTYENHMKRHNKDIGDHVCDYCHVTFSLKANLSGHIGKGHSYKFYCKLCPYACASPSQATIHVNKHKGKKYPCEECGLIFSMPNSLSTHQRYKHTTEFACALCGTVFGKERGIMHHISRVHKEDTNEQKGPLCEECDVHFATETAWKRHLVLSSKHTVSNGCDVCGETFESVNALKRHARVHRKGHDLNKSKRRIDCTLETNGGKGRMCEECDVYFTTERAWKRHLARSSKHAVSIGCKVCNETFESTDALKSHSKIHPKTRAMYKPKPKKQIDCTLCKQTVIGRDQYYAHMKEHHPEAPLHREVFNRPRKCVCEACGKGFANVVLLKYHQRIHTGEKPFPCPQCDKSYKMQESLTCHLVSHSSVRHKCHMCDQTFVYPNSLNKHIKVVHLGIRPYKCDYCEKTYPSRCEAKYHAQHVHLKTLTWPKRDRSKRKKSARDSVTS